MWKKVLQSLRHCRFYPPQYWQFKGLKIIYIFDELEYIKMIILKIDIDVKNTDVFFNQTEREVAF